MITLSFTNDEWARLAYISLDPKEYVEKAVEIVPIESDIDSTLTTAPVNRPNKVSLNCSEKQAKWLYHQMIQRTKQPDIPKDTSVSAKKRMTLTLPQKKQVIKTNEKNEKKNIMDELHSSVCPDMGELFIRCQSAQAYLDGVQNKATVFNQEIQSAGIVGKSKIDAYAREIISYYEKHAKIIGAIHGIYTKFSRAIAAATTDTELENARGQLEKDIKTHKQALSNA